MMRCCCSFGNRISLYTYSYCTSCFNECASNRERSSTPFSEDEVEDAGARKTIGDCKTRIARAEQVISVYRSNKD